MNRLFISLLFILFCFSASSQSGYLFVKKGIKKKKIYTEYDNIYLRLNNGSYRYGMITRLMNDTIWVAGNPIPRTSVAEVVIRKKEKKKFHVGVQNALLITGGVALTTAGLSISKQASFKEALIAGLVLGYGPLVIGYLSNKISLSRKSYKIGKKFQLQMLDFYIPRQRAF
jgi:hypothetical protein